MVGGGGSVRLKLRRVGGGGCNGGTIEVVEGGGFEWFRGGGDAKCCWGFRLDVVVVVLMNELGVKGLVLPSLINLASLEHSNGGTIEMVGGEIPNNTIIYEHLKQNKTIVNSTTNNIIPYKEYIEGFKNWKEQRTTSPSGRHLGHHKSLLKLDGTLYFDEEPDFGERIMKLHHRITSTTLLNASPLHRWLTSIVILLPKEKGQPKIHRL